MNIPVKISNGIALGRIISSFWIVSVNYSIWVLPLFLGKEVAGSIIYDKSYANLIHYNIPLINTGAIGFAITGWSGVVVFTMISGFSLWYSDRQRKSFDLKNYGVRRFSQVYVPYLIACVVSVVVGKLFSKMNFTEFSISGLIMGAGRIVPTATNWNSPLWYMTLLAMLYLLYPVIPMLYKKLKVWVIVVPFVIVSLVYIYVRLTYFDNYYDLFSPIYPLMPFLAYFLLGILMCQLTLKIKPKHWYYIIGSITALGLVGTYAVYRFMNPTDFYWLGGVSAFFIMGVGMLLPEKWNGVLRWLGRGTIAVFLFHYIFIYIIAPYLHLTNIYLVQMVLVYGILLAGFALYQHCLDKLVVNPFGKILDRTYEVK